MSSDSAPPSLPSLPGFAFRHACGVEDAETLHAIHAGRAERDGLDPHCTFEDWPGVGDLGGALTAATSSGDLDRWLVAQAGDGVVGYSRFVDWREDDGTRVYLLRGYVLPAWRGRGLGTAMLHWCEASAGRDAAARRPGERYEFAGNASSAEVDTTALLLQEGYRAGYTVLEMGLDPATGVPEHPLPANLDLRPAYPQHYTPIAESVAAAYRDEYAGNRYQEAFDPAAFAAELRAPRHDPTLWRVAWDDDVIAGQVLARVENGVADVFEVSVRPAYRRHGLARALLSRCLLGLRARGLEVIRLRTVAEFRTRARDLYGSVGFGVLKELPRYRKAAAPQTAPAQAARTPFAAD